MRPCLALVLLALSACDDASAPPLAPGNSVDAAAGSNPDAAGPSADAGPVATFVVHMAPDGDDANDGITRPVKTLVRVQDILRAHKPAGDVEVRIAQGTYVAPPFHDWRFYVPGHTISFLPVDYQIGGGLPAGGLPVFRNAKCGDIYCGGFWLQPRLPRETSDPLYGGGTSGLRFYYLQVEYYNDGAISVFGDSERNTEDTTYNPPLRIRGSLGLNGNTFFGMQFTHLGSLWSGGDYGYGAIVLTNSSNNRIENNHFTNIENAPPNGGYIHGLYITHFSSSNVIEHNRFEMISSDAVKVRNVSSYNSVQYNTFIRSGRNSIYRGEFCDLACATANNLARQCAEYHNRFFYNTLGTAYDGSAIAAWSLSPDGLTNAGGTPCTIPAGDQRLRTGGNSP